MNYWFLGFLLLIIAGVLLFIVSLIRKDDKDEEESKKTKVVKTKQGVRPIPKTTAAVYETPQLSRGDYRRFDKFIKEYDDGSYQFNNINYRPGARLTCAFGVAEGFKYINGQMTWGYVRVHSGVDRAGAKTQKDIPDVVISPFNFNRTRYQDFDGRIYGSLISLINDEYSFEFRIAHMHPDNDIIPWSLDQFLDGNRFMRDWYLGQAGTYGDSSGAHTHTEVKSLDEKSETLEILLNEKFGEEALKEYTPQQVIKEYRKYDKFQNASNDTILRDWEEWKKIRRAHFVNKYLYRFTDFDGRPKTRYSSYLLFNGL